MFLLLILGLMIACMPLPWPEPAWGGDSWQALPATTIAAGLVILLAAVLTRRTLRSIETNPLDVAARRYTRARQFHARLTLVVYAVMLLVLGWAHFVRREVTIRYDGRDVFIPFGELLTLAPFFVMQVGSWLAFYDVSRAFAHAVPSERQGEPFWSRGGFVLFQLRQQMAMILLPLSFVIAQQSMLRFEPKLLESQSFHAAALIVVPLVMALMPVMMVPVLGLKSMPAGPLRDRLDAHARRLNLRLRDILIWRTNNAISNAMVLGFFPRLRYVVFTDRILHDLSSDEIDAVFGHEAGHVRHRHMWTYVAFLIPSTLMLSALWAVGGGVVSESLPRQYEGWLLLPPLVLLVGYIFLVFGFLSRRCERQADLFGCKAMSCGNPKCMGHDAMTPLASESAPPCPTAVRTFIRALQRAVRSSEVARSESTPAPGLSRRLRGIKTWLTDWLHGPMSRRVEYLDRVLADPSIEPRFQRRLFALKLVLIAMPFGVLAAIAARWGWETIVFAI